MTSRPYMYVLRSSMSSLSSTQSPIGLLHTPIGSAPNCVHTHSYQLKAGEGTHVRVQDMTP